ncbi:ATP synthase subunit 5, mitochondrial [Sphaceloma murrayae]|uniref:ATP synthase subunit 5, mitochondrial n=1 Tax=Sphaceloma murrayae TaxID=2082308 RepID=A0A2K1QNZ1_9PEZI|nr:ATP synthase subunit 5, mitochondrial [Sphaceloma murrayae]
MLSTRIAARAARSAALARPQFTPAITTRFYAAPASSANTKPPVALFGVDGTYASALYTASAKTGDLDTVAKYLESAGTTLKNDPKLQSILAAPSLTAEDKVSIVNELLKTIGASSNATVKNFLLTLAENNRLSALEGVVEKFGTLMGAYRGEVELTITSAAPLEAKVLRQLETAVGKSPFVGQGKKLKVVPKVNPEIRGGLIVEVGDRTIDLSVASKMAKMNKLLKDSL